MRKRLIYKTLTLSLFWLTFLFSPTNSYAQKDLKVESLVKSLSEVRSKCILKDTSNTAALVKTFNEWNRLEPNQRKLTSFIHWVLNMKIIRGYSNEKIISKSPNLFNNSPLSKSITIQNIESITNNAQLANLISYNLLDSQYPFKIIQNENIYKEIEFYKIKKKETIAEIGAGTGIFSKLIYLANCDNTIFVNEIDNEKIEFISWKINDFQFHEFKSDLIIIKGDKKNPNIPIKVDKIIMRNSLHHFQYTRKMLKSIKASLKENGTIYVYETLRNENINSGCYAAITEPKLLYYLKKIGFKLKDKIVLGNSVAFEFVKRK